MKKGIIIFSVLLLSACSHNQTRPPEPPVEHSLIAKKIPSELLEIPPAPSPADVNGSQKDVGLWIVESEKRTKQLENQLRRIKEYSDGQ